MTQAPIGLSQSEVAMAKRCPRRWLIEYFLGYLPADPSPTGAANLGIRIHTALEGWYGYGLDPIMIIDLLYRAEIAEHPDDEHQLRLDWDLSKVMISGYLEIARDEAWDADLEVIATEAEVRVPLPGFEGVVDLRAKMDQVGRQRSTGLLSFLDHKSADNFEREEIIRQDPQMRTYSLVQWLATGQPAPMAGFPIMIADGVPLVMGGIINTLRKTKRTAKSQPPYYSRFAFRHTPDNMAAHLASTQSMAMKILTWRRNLQAAYDAGADLNRINWMQLTETPPTWINHDCRWSCHMAHGLCQLMDDGTAWSDVLVSSGRYVLGDPYERYTRGGIAAIRAQIAQNASGQQ